MSFSTEKMDLGLEQKRQVLLLLLGLWALAFFVACAELVRVLMP